MNLKVVNPKQMVKEDKMVIGNNKFDLNNKVKEKYKTIFNEQLDDNELLTINNHKHQLKLFFNGRKNKQKRKVKRINLDNKITYPSFEEGLSLEYEILEKQIKETIIIEKRLDDYNFDFSLNIGELTPKYNELEEKLELINLDNKVVYKILSPYMVDSKLETSNDCYYEVEKEGTTLNISLKVDSTWINDSKREFPIRIDPTIEVEDLTSIIAEQGILDLATGSIDSSYPELYLTSENVYKIIIDANNLKQVVAERSDVNDEKNVILRYKVSPIPTTSTIGTIKLFNQGVQIQEFEANANTINSNNLVYLNIDLTSFLDTEEEYLDLTLQAFNCEYLIFAYNNASTTYPELFINTKASDENHNKKQNQQFSLDNRNTTLVDLISGNLIHSHYDNSISHNTLSVDLNHIFDLSKKDTNSSYLGKGWKTNFNQKLEKKEYDSLLDRKEIVYLDGEGNKYSILEKWYYEVNEEKHYISKEDVVLNEEQKLVYIDENSNVYEVEYEVESDDGLIYMSASSMYNYKSAESKILSRKLVIKLADTTIELANNGSVYYNVPVFKSNTYNKIITYSSVYKEGETYFQYVGSGSKDYLTIEYRYLKLNVDEKGYYILIEDEYSNTLHTIYVKQINTYDNSSNVNYYQNEDILSVKRNIQEYKKYVNDLSTQRNEIQYNINKINNTIEEIQQSIVNVGDEIEKLEALSSLTSEEQTKLNEYRNVYQTLETNLNNYNENLSAYLDQKSKVDTNLLEYQEVLKNIYDTFNLLILQQKQSVNDFIIDKQGNRLGFDGYGNLILITDKYENSINIEYEYENDINTNKILSIYSEQERLTFEYENNLLSSIKDQLGRITKYEYDVDNNSIKVIYPDDSFTLFKINDTSFIVKNTYLKNYYFEYLNDKVTSIYSYSNENIIKEVSEAFVDETTTKAENYSISYENNVVTLLNNKKSKTYKYTFDENKNLINYLDEDVNATYTYEDNLLVRKEEINKKSDYSFPLLSAGENYYITYSNLNLTDNIKKFILLVRCKDSVSIIGPIYNASTTLYVTYEDNTTETLTFNDSNLAVDIHYKGMRRDALFEFEVNANKTPLRFDVTTSTINSYPTSQFIDRVVIIPKLIETYSYDEDKHLTKEETLTQTIEYLDYKDDKYQKEVVLDKLTNKEITTNYLYNEQGLLYCKKDSEGNNSEYYYNELGELVETRTYSTKDPSLGNVERYSYDEQGKLISHQGKIKDKNNNYPHQEYTYIHNTNLLSKVINYNKSSICYEYDPITEEMISISSSDNGVNNSNRFIYKYGLPVCVYHNGLKVNYTYDYKGRVKDVFLNDDEEAYVSYAYNDNVNNYNVSSIITETYKNGLTNQRYYDYNNKLTQATINGSTQKFYYSQDKTTYFTDSGTNYSIHYSYGKYGQTQSVNDNYLTINYSYNTNQNLSSVTETFKDNNQSITTNITYNEDNKTINLLTNTFNSKLLKTSFTYDALNRVTHQETYNNHEKETSTLLYCNDYKYLQQDENSLSSIKEHIIKVNNKVKDVINYDYDVNGNIICIKYLKGKTRFFYDELNRLIREDNYLYNKTITYSYDESGNILFKKIYSYTLEEELNELLDFITYSYECNTFKDKLTRINDKVITYDDMFNITQIGDNTLSWNTNGTLSGYETNNTHTYTYTYNHNNIRISKTIDGETTHYVVEGTKILKEYNSTYSIVYRYNLDKLIGFTYNNGTNTSEYLYGRNILGDIIAIYNEQGEEVATYKYDSYGNHIVINNNENDDIDIGNVNPYRYRGYYYDKESGLYYCNSRYYSAELSRWISLDSIDYLDPKSINGLNLYCYCKGNPVMYVDPSGHAWYNVLWDWVNTIAGFLNPISTITALGSIAVAAIDGRWSDVVDDWNNGCLNPFNQSESVALNSKVLSFYKGETVVRHSVPNSSSLQIFGTIFLNSNLIDDSYGRMTLNHEWGHGVQERILGPAYLFTVAVPSVAYYWYDVKVGGTSRDYYSMPWERTADWLGGVNRGNYKKSSLAWGIAENLLGPIVIPFYLLFGF